MSLEAQQQNKIQGDFAILSRYDSSFSSIQKVYEELGFEVTKVTKINAGQNNSLFIFENFEGERLVAKFYNKDTRQRLEREFGAFEYLHPLGLSVPKAILFDEELYFGIYSFEKGVTIKASDLTDRHIDAIVDFIIQLQGVPIADFCPGYNSYSNLKASLEIYKRRFDLLDVEIANSRVGAFLKEGRIIEGVHDLIDQQLKSGNIDRINDTRLGTVLCPIDFGPHNILFDASARPCFIDFENFGTDDPYGIIANFVTHATTTTLRPELRKLLVDSYISRRGLSDREQERLRLMIELIDIEWLLIHLNSMMPSFVERRRFASGVAFDEQEYLNSQIQKFTARYTRLVG